MTSQTNFGYDPEDPASVSGGDMRPYDPASPAFHGLTWSKDAYNPADLPFDINDASGSDYDPASPALVDPKVLRYYEKDYCPLFPVHVRK